MRHWNGSAARLATLLLTLVLMTMLMVSCGDATTTTSAGQTSTIHTKFTVALSAEDLYSFFEPRVAETEGFFEKRGLDVELVVVDSTEGAVTAFASGNVNILDGDLGAYLRAAAVDQFHPVAFYARDDTGVFDIMAPDDSPIQKVEDLEGKTIGVNSEDDPGMTLILALNTELNLNVKSLVVQEPLGAIAAFGRGEIDAYAGADADFAVMLNRGMKMRSVIPDAVKAINGGDCYWALRDTMNADPAAFTAFTQALQEARAWIGNDPQKLLEWANKVEPIAEEDMPLNMALATMVLQMRPSLEKISPYGYIKPDLWQTWWDNLVKTGVIDPSIGKPTDFYTDEFFE
jgi:NitT/TauT family transport system substrate-binding protein